MKVLVVTTFAHPDHFGGAERVITEVACRLAARGHGVTLLTGRTEGAAETDHPPFAECLSARLGAAAGSKGERLAQPRPKFAMLSAATPSAPDLQRRINLVAGTCTTSAFISIRTSQLGTSPPVANIILVPRRDGIRNLAKLRALCRLLMAL